MIPRTLFTMASVTVAAVSTIATGAEWMTDLEAAQAKAKAENKAVLVDFTGSDWCGWCIRLRSTILDTPAFQQYAADKFVLMEVDVPRNVAKIGAELHAKNRAIAAKYNITNYPSMLVLSAQGDVMGGFIGGRDTFEQVTRPLDQALHTQADIAKARTLNGTARAAALMEIYGNLRPEMKPYFRAVRDEIAQHDPDNTTGIHTEITDTTCIEQLTGKLNAAGADIHTAMQHFDEAQKTVSEPTKAKIHFMRMEYLEQVRHKIVMSAKSVEDVQKLKELMLMSADYSDPQDARALRHEINTMFTDPAAVLETLKAKQQAK